MEGHSLKLTFSPLNKDGWNTILSYWDFAYVQGELLVILIGVLGYRPQRPLKGKKALVKCCRPGVPLDSKDNSVTPV